MSAVSFKCPNCGGDLKFDPAAQKYKCEFCLSSFDQAEFEAMQRKEAPEGETPKEETPAGEASTGAAPKKETAWAGSAHQEETGENDAVLYSCPSCGAQIVTDATTAATFCYYCHNPVVLQGKLSGTYQPDLVIPFAVTRKEAEESFLTYVRKKKFVPKDFFCKEQIEKISGVYFPFWMYSCEADGHWSGQGNQIRIYHRGDTEFTETKVFAVERDADISLENLMRNALDKENRQLVEAVQPFGLEAAKEFSMGYLSGFLAEKRDMEKDAFLQELQEEVKSHAKGMMRSSISGYTAVNAFDQGIHIKKENWKYLLLPVWVLTYRGGNGKLYYYAMNGQTRKVCGVLPLDKRRLLVLFLAIFIPLMLILLMGGYFLW